MGSVHTVPPQQCGPNRREAEAALSHKRSSVDNVVLVLSCGIRGSFPTFTVVVSNTCIGDQCSAPFQTISLKIYEVNQFYSCVSLRLLFKNRNVCWRVFLPAWV